MGSTPFSIRIDEALKARLEQAAATEDRSLSYLAQKAISAFLDERDFKSQEIRRAFDDAQTGDFISDEAMNAWVDSWGSPDESPTPKADVLRGKNT